MAGETSPGKSIFLHPIPAIPIMGFVNFAEKAKFYKPYFGMFAYPRFVASYVVPVRQYRIL